MGSPGREGVDRHGFRANRREGKRRERGREEREAEGKWKEEGRKGIEEEFVCLI